MPGPLRQILHERFAQLYFALAAQGFGLGEIYQQAGGQAKTDRSRIVMGSRIAGRPDVRERISELAKPATAKTARDAAHYLGKLDQVFDGSIEDREYGHAARATELSARISGVLIDRAEIRTSVGFDQLTSVDQCLDAMIAEAGGDIGKALESWEQVREMLIERAAAKATLVNGRAIENGLQAGYKNGQNGQDVEITDKVEPST